MIEPNHAIAAIWVIVLAAAALSDLRSFRISNALPVMLVLLFAFAHSLAGFPTALWQNLFHFLLALAVGMVLFARGWIGGGDAKLYAAVALWFDWSGAVLLIFLTGVAGLLLALSFIAARMMGLRKDVARKIAAFLMVWLSLQGAVLCAAWRGWNTVFPVFSL